MAARDDTSQSHAYESFSLSASPRYGVAECVFQKSHEICVSLDDPGPSGNFMMGSVKSTGRIMGPNGF